MTVLSTEYLDGLKSIKMENDSVSLSVLPEVGGKIISLFSKAGNMEFLWSSGRTFVKPEYGVKYEKWDISGFDECFPTLLECSYPEWPWQNTLIPDKGELFSQPWKCQIDNQRLSMTAHGIRFPYKLSKLLSLRDNVLIIDYELENLSPYLFKYIWSPHPLFNVAEGARIKIPESPDMLTVFSKGEKHKSRFYESKWPWALTAMGEKVDISFIKSADAGLANKYIISGLSEGWCGIEYPNSENYLILRFPLDQLPYIGVWINEGGWPFDAEPNYNVALEPCSGYPDDLETAIANKTHAELGGFQTKNWSLEIEVT